MARTKVERLDDLLAVARGVGPARVAIASPEEREVLLAVRDAVRAGIALPYLVGDGQRIAAVAAREGIDLQELKGQLVDVPAGEGQSTEVARRAVELVHRGQATVLMKGKMETADLLRATLDRDVGLRTGRLLSHVALIEMPGLDRLLYVTDGGVVLFPNLHQKLDIARNAVAVAHALGLAEPKIAVLAPAELVNSEIPATVDAAALAKMADRGQITGALVDGPFGLDNAVSIAAAETKGIHGPVAGRADILLVPSVEAGNLMAKVMTFLAGGRMAGIVVGASAPIVITSRADPHQGKLLSIALGVILAAEQKGERAQGSRKGAVPELGLSGEALSEGDSGGKLAGQR